MKNKFILVITFTLINCCFNSSHAMWTDQDKDEITIVILPSAQVLKQRLLNLGLQYFVEKSKIDQKLGGRQISTIGIVVTVEEALYDIDKDFGGRLSDRNMIMIRIVKAILQDYPDAIKELKIHGILQ